MTTGGFAMKCMYRIGIVASALLLTMTACGRADTSTVETRITYDTPAAPNALLQWASAENGAIEFQVFDGETVLGKFVFQDTAYRQAMIDDFINTPAARVTGWTLDDITLPIYGMRLSTIGGTGIRMAWSNGFWITQTGDVYRFNFDFEAFIERHPWELASRNNQFAGFPNAIFMTLDENGWHNTFLTPAEALNPPDGIQMRLESNTNENVTFTLTNNNDTDWMYGVHYRIDVLLNDIWYSVPPQPGNWAFVNIGLILEAEQTETLTYGWGMHGDLPPGTYRLVKHGMYVVFDIY